MPVAKHLSILVVEDNKADADLVVYGLTEDSRGVTVVVVDDGPAALEYLREGAARAGVRRPDLVILDLNMPRLNGYQVLTELKSDSLLRGVPVVVLTTSKSQSEVNRGYDLGAAVVLNKPMRLAGYREMLSAVIHLWRDQALLSEAAA
jgi:chemotaxis family two-component system response regulator Rcp1